MQPYCIDIDTSIRTYRYRSMQPYCINIDTIRLCSRIVQLYLIDIDTSMQLYWYSCAAVLYWHWYSSYRYSCAAISYLYWHWYGCIEIELTISIASMKLAISLSSSWACRIFIELSVRLPRYDYEEHHFCSLQADLRVREPISQESYARSQGWLVL